VLLSDDCEQDESAVSGTSKIRLFANKGFVERFSCTAHTSRTTILTFAKAKDEIDPARRRT
jgi:hypothetical protein